jgi:hypothetical protein
VKKKLSRNKTYLQMWIERNEKEANVDKIWPAVRIFLQVRATTSDISLLSNANFVVWNRYQRNQ